MTDILAPERSGGQAHLSALAEAAVRATTVLGSRIAARLAHGEDARVALAGTTELGTRLSHEMIALALAGAEDATTDARANKLALQVLTTVPSSPVAQLLAAVTERAVGRAGAALGPLVDAGDLGSMLRWKLWTLAAEYFTPARILKHPGLAAYLSVIARRLVVDECRAMDHRGRADLDPLSIEASVDPRSTLAEILDDLDLLHRLASELPEWQTPLVDVLAGQTDREEGLRAINSKRDAAGLPVWSPDSMRTSVHRARRRLRELLAKTPSKASPAGPPGTGATRA